MMYQLLSTFNKEDSYKDKVIIAIESHQVWNIWEFMIGSWIRVNLLHTSGSKLPIVNSRKCMSA